MTNLLLTIFLGWSGVHKFIEKKWGTGLLYLLTFGCFGIGWFVDILLAIIHLKPAKQPQPAVTVTFNFEVIPDTQEDA